MSVPVKIATFIAACSLSAFATDYAAFVNPRIGTSGFGHTTVAAAYPLGMVQAGPDTGTEGWDYASGYRYEDRRIVGFSQNHLSGTGVPELGDLLILPFSNSHSNFNSKLAETAMPGYYAVTLDSGIRCEATVSQRAAVWRFTYPQGSRARLLVDMQWGLVWEKMSGHVLENSWTDGGANALSGWARTKGWTERVWNFALETDSPRVALEELPRSTSEKGSRLVLDFGDVRTLTVRVALSTTTEDGARLNLGEVRGKSFEEVSAVARAAWDRYLSRVELPGEEGAVATNVYTALYHLFYQPSDITDVDGSYRGADGKIAKVEKGHRYFSTLSLWDTYRAAHPLYTILAPELVDDFVRTMIAHRRAAGYLPVWPVWGQETHCMIGNHAVPVLCEAVNKGLTTVPAEEVYAAIRATLRENHPGKLKEDWAILDKYGYYPFDLVTEEGVSRTVEGSYDDWCAAQLAKRLGHEEDEKFFRRRSGAWRNVFDPETKTMRGRASDGSWRTPFDPSALFGYEVPRDISEANANQYAWHVQQDPSALAEAMGGKSAALARLEEHFDRRRAPHGAVADVTGLIGEYAHGNEPGHHVPYLFSLWGRPERTAEIVREIFDRFYLAKPDGLCGNDDCGQMSAWYLFSAMGFYPVEPTEGRFVYGAPQVREMRLHVGGGRTFAMRANGLSETAKYVRRVSLPSLSWRDVANGGELVFEMSERPFDVVVVGGTSAGIAAAVQATRMGARAVVLEATQRIGGMTTGGLGQTDIGDTSAFRGLARQFYRDVKSHYDDPKSWRWQKKEQYRPNGQTAGSSDGETMWTFEPSAALAVLEAWERKEGLRVERGAALDRSGVETEGGRIVSVRTKDGRVWRGDVFIDATYEGDLMAAAGVSYRVGREANSEYGETLNGLQRAGATKHQILPGVSAYKVAGDPASGLLPGVEAKDDERADGEGDKRVQAYCYRLCLTDVPGNRIPFAKPEGYDEADYELLLRNAERTPEDTVEHWRHQPWNNSPMPNRKTDTNNRTGVSMDFIGGSWRWAEATDDERGRIAAQHERWQRGALWTLANNPRVPAYVRNEVAKWGLCKDEFTENGGWPTQLYVREARRMVGEYVMTEANCRGRRVAERPVAYAAYTMDSHHVRRYADADGFVRNEGDVQDKAGVKGPYPIDYGAIVPKRGECANLLVPICLSATHIAYGSIRMEPVFFATGQAAGAAAALASKENCAVQDVGYAALSDAIGDSATLAKIKANVVASLTEGRGRLLELRESLASCGADTGDSTVKAVIESVCPPSAEEAVKYVATLGEDGRWPDVDYETVTRSAWPVRDHLRRMKAIARVPHTAESVAAFRLALGAWLRGGFRNPNWWWNEIGVPLELGAACLAMDGELTESERAAVVERLRESKIGMTGQNRIWVAECVLYRALIEGNAEDARAAREAIVGEVKTSDTAEGIQADWSFHQHGNQPQFGNYGASYIMSVPRLLRFLDGTPWAAPEDKMEIMRKLVANGFLPTVWRGSMDVGAIGRQLGRGAARMKGAAVLLAAEELGIDASVAPGLHWFHKSAMGEYRAEGWMAGVKCQTAKVQGTEKVNEDNLLGAHLADGALFCYATGDEYRDIFPLWNWRHVPGTTSYDIGEVDWKNDNKADVCVAEGDVVRFELDRAGLKARTTWRFSPSGVEVEVADVAVASGLPVVTTVEQSVAQANAAWRREGDGIVAVNGAFRYDLPSNAVVRVERRKGNWKRHMGAMPDAEVEGDVFEITIPHGVDPSGASCRWKVSPL